MNTDSKHTDWILETIDHLRRRKARPDLQRICHVVRRNYGLLASDTEAKLEKLVDAEIVIKVDYKGSTSYRNAAKWRKSNLGCAVQNSKTVSTKIIEAIKALSKIQEKSAERHGEQMEIKSLETNEKTLGDHKNATKSTFKGASFEEIDSWLLEHYGDYKHLKSPMSVVLKREVEAGRIRQILEDGCFILTEAQKQLITNDTIVILEFPQKTDSNNGNYFQASANGKNSSGGFVTSNHNRQSGLVKSGFYTGHQPARRGRPPKWKPSTLTSSSTSSPQNAKTLPSSSLVKVRV